MHTDAHLIEHFKSRNQVFSGNFLQVYRDTVELPNGQAASREFIEHPGAVAIIAIDDQDNLILERQYRHPVGQVILELPAGKIDPNEQALICGQRELLEETGYSAKEWHYLGECLPCIAYSSERIHYFEARALSYSHANLDDGEFLEVIKLPFQQVMELAWRGQIKDSKTLAGLMLYYGYRQTHAHP